MAIYSKTQQVLRDLPGESGMTFFLKRVELKTKPQSQILKILRSDYKTQAGASRPAG